MRLYRILFALLASVASMTLSAQVWIADTLGGKFEVRYFDQGQDYSGKVRSSVIRLLPDTACHQAVVYIHGFNDYFFQREMAEKFVGHGYAFYAIDLRKYGRSLLDGQKRCQVRNFKEYFADIDSALLVVKAAGQDVAAMIGHSTGGLVAAYYLSVNGDEGIESLILNSPFLDWNLGKLECMVNGVGFLGRIMPGVSFKSGSGSAYGESLHRDYHGEWDFNTQWKSLGPTIVDLGWVNAVNSAQRYLKHHEYSIDCPILLMYSAKSIEADEWSEAVGRADAVLDVEDIRKYGMKLGHDVTAVKVIGGIHDLVLSAKDVREPLYNYIFSWLSEH